MWARRSHLEILHFGHFERVEPIFYQLILLLDFFRDDCLDLPVDECILARVKLLQRPWLILFAFKSPQLGILDKSLLSTDSRNDGPRALNTSFASIVANLDHVHLLRCGISETSVERPVLDKDWLDSQTVIPFRVRLPRPLVQQYEVVPCLVTTPSFLSAFFGLLQRLAHSAPPLVLTVRLGYLSSDLPILISSLAPIAIAD